MSIITDRLPPWNALLLVSADQGNAADRSYSGRTPTVGADVTFATRCIDFGGATTAIVTYPDSADFEAAPFTISFWARIDSSSTRVSLVAKNTITASPSTYLGWYVHFIGTAAGSFGMVVTTNTNGSNYRSGYTGSPTTYGDGTWRHFVWVCDNINVTTNWRLYVNGVSVSLTYLTAGTVSTIANSEPLTLGGFTTLNQTARLNGALDDVRIYNTALTANEAYAAYIEGLGVTRP